MPESSAGAFVRHMQHATRRALARERHVRTS
jgi:hypothetical protein